MRFTNYLKESKKINKTMIGLAVSKQPIVKYWTYIKSWLDRYDIPYELPKEWHISIAQIPDAYNKDELIRVLNALPNNYSLNPKGLNVFEGVNVKRDFFVMEYKPNQQFLDSYNKIEEHFEIRKFGTSVRPHLSLFSIKRGDMPLELINDMMQMASKPPKIKVTEIELWNSKFEIDFRRK